MVTRTHQMAHGRTVRWRCGRTRRLGYLLAGLLVAAIVAGCGGASASGGGTIKVGLLWPFSGAYSNYGPDGKAGVQLALSQAGMKVGDRKIKLFVANENVLDPSQTLADAKTLVEQDGVKVVLGPVFGSSQQAVGPYFASHGVLAYSPYGTTLQLAKDGAFVSWPSVDTAFSTPLGGYLYNTLGYRKIATIAPDYVYGHDLIAGATKTFTAAGGKVLQQQWVPLGTTDLLPYASHLDRGVDAVVMWLVPSDFATFLTAYQSLGIKLPLILINGVFDPTFQQIGSKMLGTLGLMDWSLGLQSPANQQFVSAFKKRYGTEPDNNNAAAYADTEIMLADLKATGGSTDGAKMRGALRNLAVQTPYGPAKLNSIQAGVTSRTIVKATRRSDGYYVWAPVKTFNDVPGS